MPRCAKGGEQVGGGEHVPGGHDLPQMPPVVQLSGHRPSFRPGRSAWSAVRAGASARRSAVFMKSSLTWAYTAVELSLSWPT
jgi:hypothetical protein